MKKFTTLVFFITLALLFRGSSNCYSQNVAWNNFRGNNMVKKGAFEKGLYYYQQSLKKAPLNYLANKEIGRLYLYTFQVFDSAFIHLDKVIAQEKKDSNYFDYFDYANALRLSNQPNKAINYYELFYNGFVKGKKLDSPELESFISNNISFCLKAIELAKTPNEIIILKNMDFFINSKENEYTPVLIEEDSAVMFNARYKDLKNEKQFADYQYMENVYSFDLKESVSSTFDEILEQGNHHAVVSKNLGSDTIVLFYQNLLWVGSIYQQRLTKQQPLPKNLSNFYFQPHGVFSRDNKEFYFSAMKTETDNLDIYVSNKLADGNWSNPIKIKGKINSGESEDSPFLSKDSKTMYFSSKGHNSSGGYDIFKSHLINGEWSEPEILPTPYNSAGDDIYFTLSENEKYGYLSSNRLGGFGRMDLYEFGTVPKATFDCEEFASATTEAVNIEFTAKEEYLPYEQIILDANNSSVEGYSLNYFYWMVDGEKLERNGPIILLDSLQLGEHEVKLQIFGDSKMQRHTWCASAKFTVLKEATFDTTAIASAVDFISKDSLDILMDQNSTKPLIDFKPSPIYFGFDKTELTEKSIIDLENLKLFLNENPKVKIILTGHTDAMGDASYNDLLAKDRALEAANYLLNNGISKNRIVKTLGKGEKEPANPNELSNGADNIAGRKLNRRVEFTLLIE